MTRALFFLLFNITGIISTSTYAATPLPLDSKFEFIFVRHGSTPWSIKEIDQGVCDYPLDPKGIEEVKDRKSTRLNSSHIQKSRMPSSA